MQDTHVERIIKLLGGSTRKAGKALRKSHSTVQGWRKLGYIPTNQQRHVYTTARRVKKSFTRKDLLGF